MGLSICVNSCGLFCFYSLEILLQMQLFYFGSYDLCYDPDQPKYVKVRSMTGRLVHNWSEII